MKEEKKTVYPHTEQSILGNIDEKLDDIHGHVTFIGWLMLAIFLITLALLLGGCSVYDIEFSDGSKFRSRHFLDATKIGSVSYDEGSFVLEGYLSETDRLIGIIQRLIAREEVGQ